MTLIKSMTGYGRAVETVNGREFTVELRSVNNRYLDCTVKLPRSLSFAEEAVKQAVKASVSRGKVDVFVTVKSETADDTRISLNTSVVEGYLAAMRQMVESYGVKDDISVSTLSRMNDVFTVEKPQVDEEQLQADLMRVVEQALSFLPPRERKEAVKKSCQRTFQALRIDVNSEFEVLYAFLEKLPGVLKPGGKAAILTFHSGEDRLVKQSFRQLQREGIYSSAAKDVIRPSAEECFRNPRARSTKMRWAIRA